ncbi:hypothetical protein DSO57_1026332 [Entomophthora muscae]|uniref:Uncharacterized protein n=1 Tax=Entomophthora muscae TaxID=34485 RepID=A0ACC2UMU5_9FUNG|nr:hypothetical protein DSO57_1026332 [Entomophthora muscae]
MAKFTLIVALLSVALVASHGSEYNPSDGQASVAKPVGNPVPTATSTPEKSSSNSTSGSTSSSNAKAIIPCSFAMAAALIPAYL